MPCSPSRIVAVVIALIAIACGEPGGGGGASADGSPASDSAVADDGRTGTIDAGPRADAADLGEGSLWSDDFEGTDGSIQSHDSSWRQIFGRLDVHASDGVVRANPGAEDGNDDYGYKPQPATELVITADVYWSHADAVGVTVVCPKGAVDESLYELSLYEGRLQLLRYDGGGNPSVYQVLAQSSPLPRSDVDYRLVFTAARDGATWTLSGEVRDPDQGFGVVASIDGVTDATHGDSIGQGIGIYDNSGELSRVYAMRVDGSP